MDRNKILYLLFAVFQAFVLGLIITLIYQVDMLENKLKKLNECRQYDLRLQIEMWRDLNRKFKEQKKSEVPDLT